MAQTWSTLGNKNLRSASALLYYVTCFSADLTLLFLKLTPTDPGFYWEPGEPLTSDVQHGSCDGVQSLVRNFSGVIQLAVFQREPAHRTLHLDVTGLMITLHKRFKIIDIHRLMHAGKLFESTLFLPETWSKPLP